MAAKGPPRKMAAALQEAARDTTANIFVNIFLSENLNSCYKGIMGDLRNDPPDPRTTHLRAERTSPVCLYSAGGGTLKNWAILSGALKSVQAE